MQERQRIGETLRAARLAKGVSLEEAAAATRIRRSALQALETDEYDALPASVYTRGFLVNYTRYLGLHPAEVVEEYDRQQRQFADPEVSATPQEESGRQFSLFSSKILWTVIFIIVLGVALNFVYQEFLSAGPAPEPTEVAAAPTSAPTPFIEPTPVPTQPPPPTPTAVQSPTPIPISGVNVTLRATTQQVWIGVSVDGASVFAGTIGPETSQGTEPLAWSAEESISILFGRTGGVELSLNEREFGSLVESRDPVTFEAVRSGDGPVETTVSIGGTPVPASQ